MSSADLPMPGDSAEPLAAEPQAIRDWLKFAPYIPWAMSHRDEFAEIYDVLFAQPKASYADWLAAVSKAADIARTIMADFPGAAVSAMSEADLQQQQATAAALGIDLSKIRKVLEWLLPLVLMFV